MSVKIYAWRYSVRGTAAKDQTWRVVGVAHCRTGSVWDTVMAEIFDQLTRGKAVYGKPGVGCDGPYQVIEFHIEQVEDSSASAH